LYECRLAQKEGHERDFLTVGSMGHASQIALGIAMAQPERKVYCLDGDGAVLMHMGAMPIIGQSKCRNLRHIVLNNGAHVSVGGQLTVALSISLKKIASACGYEWSASVDSPEGLGQELKQMAMAEGPAFLETKISQSARSDLLRPKSSPAENKDAFMQFLQSSDISSS
jgi:phosphonopyruvate decarboxylase